MNYSTTQIKILTEALQCIQLKGFNAFSYKDIAKAVNIKTSSIHYHYPTKEDLGLAVIDWQLFSLSPLLNDISSHKDWGSSRKCSELCSLIIQTTYDDNYKMCLGGMFASDALSLSDAMKSKIRDFFNFLLNWITNILQQDKTLSLSKKQTVQFAEQFIMQLEGALLLGRLYQSNQYFNYLNKFIKRELV